MPRLLSVYAVAAALLGCTTYKTWTETSADRDLGLVQLSYEYRKWENPQVDERAGIMLAREHCRDWGYRDAQRKGEDRQCLEGAAADCSKWQVIREFQCLKELAQ
jgi:YecR-like lipoprotein